MNVFWEWLRIYSDFRHSVIHGDGNDHNVLVNGDEVSLIDFGDLHYSATICELAISCAYIAFNKKDPLLAMAEVVRGYHDLEEREIEALFPLILLRLAVSVANSAYLKATNADPYTTISEQSAWEALRALSKIHPRVACYVFRHACGRKPLPDWVSPKAGPVMHGFDSAEVLDMTTATEMPSPARSGHRTV